MDQTTTLNFISVTFKYFIKVVVYVPHGKRRQTLSLNLCFLRNFYYVSSIAESSNILENSINMGKYYSTCFKMELGKFMDGNVEYK